MRVLIVGKKSWGKGTDYALGAAHRVHRERPDIHFRFVGPGTLDVRCGYIADVPPVAHQEMRNEYAWADVVVHPSLMEADPRAVREAREAGVPVIATTTAGVRGQGDVTLVPPRDPVALAEAILACRPS